MSLYSHGSARMEAKIGLPFCRGETKIEEGAEREGRACGVGCWIFGGGALVVDGVTEGLFDFSTEAAGAIGATEEKSISGPKSSSMSRCKQGRQHSIILRKEGSRVVVFRSHVFRF